MALYIGKKVGSPTVIKEVESGDVISVENNSFNIELETVSGVLKKKSNIGSGSAKTLDIDVVASDSQFEVFDLELDTTDNIKSNEDYVIGFTDDVLFYDCIKENPADLSNITPLQVTFPNGAVYSHKYNKQINYNSKTVYFFNYTDMFDYPIIGYEDDGSEVLMNMYVIYNDLSCEIVLLNEIMTPSDIPSGFTDYMFVRQITIPAHAPFHAEIIQQDWTNPKLTTNGTVGGTSCACAADSYYGSSYYQYRAFDNSTSSYWRNNHNSTPTWITYYTPVAVFVTSVVFSFNSIASAGRIEGSNDNSTWTTIGTFSGNTSSTLTVECSSTVPYKYIRFYRTSTYSGSYGAIYDMTINGFTSETKWFCKDLITHIQNNDTHEPESFLNANYYSPNGKFVSSDDQPLISTLEYESGCLYKYTDDGFGSMDTKSFVIKYVDSDEYKIAITDKTVEEIQGDETIEYVEEIDYYVLPTHYNFTYIGEEPTPNFEIVGTLTDNDGVFSGYNESNYIRLENEFNPGNNPWEMVLKITTGDSFKSSEYWFGCENGNNGLLLVVVNDHLGWFLSSTGSSWNIASSDVNYILSTNTTYLVRASYDLSTYKLEVSSDDGQTWSTSSTINSTERISPCYLFGGASWDKSSAYFGGSIDMKESYIKVDGNYWWTAYSLPFTLKDQFQSSCNFVSNDEPTNIKYITDNNSNNLTYLAPYNIVSYQPVYGCLVNYEDNGLANILKAYKVTYTDNNVGVVLSTDDSFTVENMSEKTYLADVVIPNHKLFTYGEKTVQTPWENSKLTGNGTMGGTSSACQTSGYYSSNYYPYYAFDRNTNNYWHSNNTKPQWITYYTPLAVYIDTIKILLSSYNPFFFEIQGSNNNTDWDILVDDMNKNNTSGQTIEIPVNSENPYKYIRLVNKKGYNSTYTTVNEMYIYGHTLNSENGWIPVESM